MDIEELYDRAVNEFEDIIFLGDLKAVNSEFWSVDVTNVESRDLHTECITLGLTDLIYEPTRIVNHMKSCIDLILYNKLVMVGESGVGVQNIRCLQSLPYLCCIKF